MLPVKGTKSPLDLPGSAPVCADNIHCRADLLFYQFAYKIKSALRQGTHRKDEPLIVATQTLSIILSIHGMSKERKHLFTKVFSHEWNKL